MKKAFALLLMLTSIHTGYSQNWLWTRTATTQTNLHSIATATVADAAGNVYVAGYFDSRTLAFGSLTISNDSASYSDSTHFRNIYLVKYTSSGSVIWAKSFGGKYDDQATRLCMDKAGYLYMCGSFYSPTIRFGAGNYANAGGEDLFLTKFDGNGTVIWARTAGGQGNDNASALCVDKQGGPSITGSFDSPSLILGTQTLHDTSNYSVPFTARFDSSGNVLWARSATGNFSNSASYGLGIGTDSSMNLYVTGAFGFQRIQFGSHSLLNAGLVNAFVVKYDTAGKDVWALRAGGSKQDGGTGLAADGQGNTYVCGAFYSPSIQFGSVTLHNAGSGDVFLVKLDSSGTAIWATRAGGSGTDAASSVSIDANGFAYICGGFGSASMQIGGSVLVNQGTESVFVAEYDYNGSPLWASGASGSGYNYATDVFADAQGSAFLVGYYNSTFIAFGSTPALIGSGNSNLFLAKTSGVTGIASLAVEVPHVLVYPNPCHTMAYLQLSEAPALALEVILYNDKGQEVKRLPREFTQIYSLPCADLIPGLYFYQLRDTQHNSVYSGKLIVD
jgi:hypothetical protein